MLITRFMTPDGVSEVTDFMPVAGELRRTGTGWYGCYGSCERFDRIVTLRDGKAAPPAEVPGDAAVARPRGALAKEAVR
jgi:hypothetical protein